MSQLIYNASREEQLLLPTADRKRKPQLQIHTLSLGSSGAKETVPQIAQHRPLTRQGSPDTQQQRKEDVTWPLTQSKRQQGAGWRAGLGRVHLRCKILYTGQIHLKLPGGGVQLYELGEANSVLTSQLPFSVNFPNSQKSTVHVY